jgi:dienelactone hydrolase
MALGMILSVPSNAERTTASAVTLRLYAGVAPGSEHWQQVERTTGNPATGARMLRNVVSPTIEVFLPDQSKAVGLGVLIAPGGGFRFLSYDTEGVYVARWLAEHGIVGIVLKYRTVQTSADDAVVFRRPPAASAPARLAGPLPGAQIGIADGIQAMQIVRRHAAQWGFSPERVGILGFSAGAQVTVGVVRALATSGSPPLFAAPIYGGDFGAAAQALPKMLPPMFLAVSADDALAGPVADQLYRQLLSAGDQPEYHVFYRGGHGWGMEHHNDTADHWIDEFYWWLSAHGWLRSAPKG